MSDATETSPRKEPKRRDTRKTEQDVEQSASARGIPEAHGDNELTSTRNRCTRQGPEDRWSWWSVCGEPHDWRKAIECCLYNWAKTSTVPQGCCANWISVLRPATKRVMGNEPFRDQTFDSSGYNCDLLPKMKNTKPKVQGCLACEHGINVSIGRKHTFACRQTILPSLVTDSMWKGVETS